MSAAWVTAASALAVALGGGLAVLAHWIRRMWRRVGAFLDDWGGEQARPGVPDRPGVMARLQTAETLIAKVLAETLPNGGASLRDVVHQTQADVSGMKGDVAAMRARMELFETQRASREKGTT